jgi:hypothetical protein
VQKDNGLDELLPGQKYNVAKYYNEDQVLVKLDLLISGSVLCFGMC